MQTIDYWVFSENAKPDGVSDKVLEDPQAFTKAKLQGSPFDFGVDNITRNGLFLLLGYAYDLRPFLKRYIYKQYGQWQEMYALNKTNLRKLVHGRVDEITKLTN